MQERQRLLILMLIMATAVLAAVAVALYSLYRAALDEQKRRL